MNILVIKQTSLGDVLHASGHLRAIKRQYPAAHLTVLTADTSAAIYRDNPNVDEIIEFQRYRVKANWWRTPLWTIAHLREVMGLVRARHYQLAIDLQGRWKSVMFLYAAHAERRFVKGRWPFLRGFRDRDLHALREMDRVLELAGIEPGDTSMAFHVDQAAAARAERRLRASGWNGKPYLVVSPFTRWPSKNWSLSRYAALVRSLGSRLNVVVTGAAGDRERVARFVAEESLDEVINLCGDLSLEEFAAVTGGAAGVVSGDSFAMHLAAACKTPVVALFGPTAESRVAPDGENAAILRADNGCAVCYRRDCPRRCIDAIGEDEVIDALLRLGVLTTPGR